MILAIDIETNSLISPSRIWVVCAQDINTGAKYVFREPTTDPVERERFISFAASVDTWVGHNWLEFDYPQLYRLLGLSIPDVAEKSIDTLVLSRLVNYSDPHATGNGVRGSSGARPSDVPDAGASAGTDVEGSSVRDLRGHSIESYGEEFGLEKIDFSDFTHYSKEMEDYCARDVEICKRIYFKYRHIIDDPAWRPAISLEHNFQLLVNSLHDNGFCFDRTKAEHLLSKVTKELEEIDAKIETAFPPQLVVAREFTPRATKHGTISKTSVPRSEWHHIHDYEIGKTYQIFRSEAFNASSHKQLIRVLTEAAWQPEAKTKTHIETEREINRLKYNSNRSEELDNRLKLLQDKLNTLRISGWQINETNLATLPPSAPEPARLLAKRILLESRRRTLTEWLNLVGDDGRIHGKFYGIGAWTHRMAHREPNTANIPSEFREDGSVKLYGKEMRQLWRAPKNRLLVGVDAEGIQLRIFAHLINDPEFTDALVRGRKQDKTDPHSLNQKILGSVCKSRQAAKRLVYAMLLGGGMAKFAQVLGCTVHEAEEAIARLLRRYEGWAKLKENDIPRDARRGCFRGLDNRSVPLPGETIGQRKHLWMSGQLQNGEAIIMKRAAIKWHKQLGNAERWHADKLKELRKCLFVNQVHDEWQTEVPNNMAIAMEVAKLQADAIREVGEELNLRCPMAGSYWNDDHKDYTIGTNWYQTH